MEISETKRGDRVAVTFRGVPRVRNGQPVFGQTVTVTGTVHTNNGVFDVGREPRRTCLEIHTDRGMIHVPQAGLLSVEGMG